MHHRYQHINVPTEIVRTLVVISETGSFSRAGEKLGLSQPAISAQMKRLQVMVGGAVFERTAGGVAFTPKGKLVLGHARKLLDSNDQILSLGGAFKESQPFRLGLPVIFVKQFFRNWRPEHCAEQIHIICDHSTELSRALVDGYLDIACLVNAPADLDEGLFEWREDHVWVRSRGFTLPPGSPIPLVGWVGGLADRPMIDSLEKAGAAYRIMFASTDHQARMTAVGAGIGVMALPERQVADPLVIAKEYYLPPLSPLRAGIFVRHGADSERAAPVIKMLKDLAPVGQK